MTAEERALEYCVNPHPHAPDECKECQAYMKGYHEGQSNPNAAAVARVLGEATDACRRAREGGNTDCKAMCHERDIILIEAMIPEPEPKEAGDD